MTGTTTKDDVNELVLSLRPLPSVTGVQLLCGEEEKACTANEVLTAENMIYNVIDLSSDNMIFHFSRLNIFDMIIMEKW